MTLTDYTCTGCGKPVKGYRLRVDGRDFHEACWKQHLEGSELKQLRAEVEQLRAKVADLEGRK